MSASPNRGASLAYAIKATALTCEELIVKDAMTRTYPDALMAPIGAFAQSLIDGGLAFEPKAAAALLTARPTGIADLRSLAGRDPESRAARERATLEAVSDPRVDIIISPRFGPVFHHAWLTTVQGSGVDPRDTAAWVSEPDIILCRRSPTAAVVLLPVDIKHHTTRKEGSGRSLLLISALARPFPEEGSAMQVKRGDSVDEDALQLAHYVTHLRAWGLGDDRAWGGVLGRELDIAWIDLDVELVQGTPALARYAEAATRHSELLAHGRDRDRDREEAKGRSRVTGPEWKPDCDECRWRNACRSELESEYPGGHITLLAGVTPTRAAAYYAMGISGAHELARQRLGSVPDDIHVVQARAVLQERAYRTPDAADPLCPSADVEIDFDIEFTSRRFLGPSDGGEIVYAWGWLESSPDGEEESCFLDWDEPDPTTWDREAGEAAAFAAFWSHLRNSQESARARGRSWLAFHYHSPEPSRMRRLAHDRAGFPGVPSVEEVEALLQSGQVIDLKAVVDMIVWPLPGKGLKPIAKWVGHQWASPDAGGDMSIVWRELALMHPDPSLRDDNRTTLRTYNLDDVRAQRSVRQWIREHGSDILAWPDA